MPPRLPKIFLALSALLFASSPLRLHAELREIATLVTSAGTMEFELFRDVSPRSVKNFKYLADTHFYDGTKFHRITNPKPVDPFNPQMIMVQGGDPNTRNAEVLDQNGFSNYGSGGPEYTIPDEPTRNPNRSHVRGVLSMAKTAYPNSGGSGFFIVYDNATHLDGVHAPLGSLISGEEVLKSLTEVELVGDKPKNPPLLLSVQIRSEEIAGSTPVIFSSAFASGMAHGLLRNVDRTIFGCYQISLTKTGTLSGQLEYFGRKSSFTGKLTPVPGSTSENESTVLIDSKSAFPLRIKIRSRRVTSTGASLSVTVGGLNPGATDRPDYTILCGATELAIPALGNRYTTILKPDGLTNVRGAAFLTLNFLKSSGMCIASGKLADGRALTFSKIPTSEGGRYTYPIFLFEPPRIIEPYRSQFPSIDLGWWQYIGSPATWATVVNTPSPETIGNLVPFKVGFSLKGALEMRPSGDPADVSPPIPPEKDPAQTKEDFLATPAVKAYLTDYAAYSNWITNRSNLYWYRQALTTSLVPAEQSVFLISTMAPWTPPATSAVLAPFQTTSGAGHVSGGNLAPTAFQISRTNTTTTFGSNPAGVILRFNPLDGTFQGSYTADSSRVSFYGINVIGSGYTKSSGFAIKSGASIPVWLTAP